MTMSHVNIGIHVPFVRSPFIMLVKGILSDYLRKNTTDSTPSGRPSIVSLLHALSGAMPRKTDPPFYRLTPRLRNKTKEKDAEEESLRACSDDVPHDSDYKPTVKRLLTIFAICGWLYLVSWLLWSSLKWFGPQGKTKDTMSHTSKE